MVLSQRDSQGRRISVPDPSFIDEVGDLARRMYESRNSSSLIQVIHDELAIEIPNMDIARIEIFGDTLRDLVQRFNTEMDMATGAGLSNPPREAFPTEIQGTIPTSRHIDIEDIDWISEVENFRQIAEQYPVPEIRTTTGRYRSDQPNISNPPGTSHFDIEYSQAEIRMMSSLGIPSEYLSTENRDELAEEGEFEIVARTTTNTTRRRQTRTPGRATVTAPLEKKPPLYIWVVRSSKAYGGQHVQYEVQLNTDGSVSCGCAGWKFKKKDEERRCKHTDLIKEEAKDFFKRHKRGEQLPTTDPTDEQLNSARNTGGNPVGDTSIKYGRIIDLD